MNPVVKKSSRLLLLAAILVSCLGCDRITKEVATRTLKNAPPMSFLGDTVRIVYAENPGAFLGWGGELPPQVRFALLTVINGGLLVAVAGFLIFRWDMDRMTFAALALILAGGIGNLIDRAFQDGLVIDFINLGIGPLRTGIFNVADMAITLGAMLAFLLSLRPVPEEPQP